MDSEYLRRLFHYDSDTGIFTRLSDRGPNGREGQPAGTVAFDGYVVLTIDHRKYKAHRLAWLYVYGEWPPGRLDHRDRIKTHNWIDNLRLATAAQNTVNTVKKTGYTSKYKGVSWKRSDAKWRAALGSAHIGLFKSEVEAAKAYNERVFEVHGEFAVLNEIHPAVCNDAIIPEN